MPYGNVQPGTPPTPATQPGQLSATPAASMGGSTDFASSPGQLQDAGAMVGIPPGQAGQPVFRTPSPTVGGGAPMPPTQQGPRQGNRPFNSPPEGDYLKMLLEWKAKAKQGDRMPPGWFPELGVVVPKADLGKGTDGLVNALADINPITAGLTRNFFNVFGGANPPKNAREVPKGSALPDHVSFAVSGKLAEMNEFLELALASGKLTPEQTAGAVRLSDTIDRALANYYQSQGRPASQNSMISSDLDQAIDLALAGRNTEAMAIARQVRDREIAFLQKYMDPAKLAQRDTQNKELNSLRRKALTAASRGKWKERDAIWDQIDALSSQMRQPVVTPEGQPAPYSTEKGMP